MCVTLFQLPSGVWNFDISTRCQKWCKKVPQIASILLDGEAFLIDFLWLFT